MKIIYEPKGRAREYAPLAANLYRGCGHGCTYCYVPGAMRMSREQWGQPAVPRENVLELLEKDCRALSNQTCVPPVFFSFSTDPYNPTELRLGLMRKAILMLKTNGLSVNILTKAGVRARGDLGLLDYSDSIGVTLTTMDSEQSSRWEPHAATPRHRVELLREAQMKHIYTWASLEPVLDPDASLAAIEASHPFVDLYKVGKLNHGKSDIDWADFGERAIALMLALGKQYYIKEDLRRHLKNPKVGLTLEQVELAALDRTL